MHFITYNNWQIVKKDSDVETLQQFSSIENVFLCEGEIVVKDKISKVIKYSGSGKKYYIKRYTASGRKLFSFFRKSRIRSESENLASLNKLGIPVPKIIAHGEKKKNGHFLEGALITEEVENSANLAHHLSHNTDLINNKKWLYSVIGQLANYIRNMHEKKFIHGDLNVRNVLVQALAYPAVYLIDCPAGGFKTGYFLKRGIIRDLAHLDKVARYTISKKDLLKFYKKYKQTEKLTPADKKLIAKIRHFHDKHRAKKNNNNVRKTYL